MLLPKQIQGFNMYSLNSGTFRGHTYEGVQYIKDQMLINVMPILVQNQIKYQIILAGILIVEADTENDVINVIEDFIKTSNTHSIKTNL